MIMMKFDEPKEIEIQWTEEYARTQSEEDEDSLDEEAISDVDWQIGESRETVEINSWDEIPEGYEPVNENDAQEYNDYLRNDRDD
jgi:murein tripeptide amidase MpaA